MPDPLPGASTFVEGVRVSAIKEMAMRAARIEGVASLTWGVPSFQTPASIRTAVERALEDDPDVGKYTLPDGLPELRRQVVQTHLEATGIEVDADRHVSITAGNMEAVQTLLHTILDPGDEVIVTDPGFASHLLQIGLAGGKPVFWGLDESEGWTLNLESLPGLVTERTKAILIVTPSNPTGRIFSESELRAVGELARERGLLVILDDPYSHFTYGYSDPGTGKEGAFNLSSVPELAEHIAYLFSFSKCHALSGYRIGYAVLPERLKAELLKVHDATLICAPRISQVAALAALRGEGERLREFEDILNGRRALIGERLRRVPHVFDFVEPQGAYYVFPRIVAEHEDSREFAIRLLEEARVAVTPGAAFGPTGEGHVRMAFCVPDEEINRAFDQIEAYFGLAG